MLAVEVNTDTMLAVEVNTDTMLAVEVNTDNDSNPPGAPEGRAQCRQCR